MYPSSQDHPSGDPGHHKIAFSSDNVSLILNSLFGDMIRTLSPKPGTDVLVPENGDRLVSPKNESDGSRGRMGFPRQYDVSERSALSLR